MKIAYMHALANSATSLDLRKKSDYDELSAKLLKYFSFGPKDNQYQINRTMVRKFYTNMEKHRMHSPQE